MGKTIDIDVEYLTRVEGHGNIVVNTKNGEIEKCELQIVEAPRFFEGMLQGRSIFEAQHITSRICGICACGHSLASISAAEDAIDFTPSLQTKILRKLLMHIEILDSHILHIYLLAAPDLLGVKSFIPLIKTHNDVVRRALRMKKTCNDICDILVGRHVHPISSIVGGWTKLPSEKNLDDMLAMLLLLEKDLTATVELASTLTFPEFGRETEYIALVNNNGEYPFLEGDIGSTDGLKVKKKDYKTVTNEFVVPHSSGKHTKASRESYMVGALARLNLNHNRLHPNAKKIAKAIGLKPICVNPFLNTAAQLIECAHCLEDSINIITHFKNKGVNHDEAIIVGLNENKTIKIKKGKGVGAVEVPRGLLFHEYEINEKGKIINANCIIPTGQNLNNIEHDMRKLVKENIKDKTKKEITLLLEMLVRAYDPCISCSAHMLDVKFI